MAAYLFIFEQGLRSFVMLCERETTLMADRVVGSGSTGIDWQCHFDNSEDLFAAKIFEVLHRSDAYSRWQLRNEFDIHVALEKTFQSGKLHNCIAPRCYGVFENDGVDVLVFELWDDILKAWDELSDSEW
jgi:hypothetical protein